MKIPTIWESASRPLFVRSVWLESSDLGGGGRRHFILDYEPRLKLNSNNLLREKRDNFEIFTSTESSERNTYKEEERFLFIGPTKLQHPGYYSHRQLKTNQPESRRISTAIKKPKIDPATYHYLQLPSNVPSRRSSLQDMNSTISYPCSSSDEKLAERVLNWLDLAGKNELIESSSSTYQRNKMPGPAPITGRKRAATASHRNANRNSENFLNYRRPDSVKHITIVFDKEGFPLRLNRQAKDSESYTMTSRVDNDKQLDPGSITEMRFPNGGKSETIECVERCKVVSAFGSRKRSKATGLSLSAATIGRRSVDTIAGDRKSAVQKSLSDDVKGLSTHEVKKQLHIFMPSLPKKGVHQVITDDSVSVLSAALNEQCRI